MVPGATYKGRRMFDVIRSRLAAASPGPWKAQDGDDDPIWMLVFSGVDDVCGMGPHNQKENAAFVEHAPTDIQLLLRAVDIMEKALASGDSWTAGNALKEARKLSATQEAIDA